MKYIVMFQEPKGKAFSTSVRAQDENTAIQRARDYWKHYRARKAEYVDSLKVVSVKEFMK